MFRWVEAGKLGQVLEVAFGSGEVRQARLGEIRFVKSR